MYFNVRRAPAAFLAFLPLPATLRPTPAPLKAVAPPGKRPASGRRVSNSGSHPGHTVMAQIPPSSNPRGELIFSSRVDQHFEEGYKRYRTAFERRRGQRDKLDAASAAPWYARLFRRGDSPTPEAAAHELSHRRGSSGSRASVSASSTNSALSPPASRRSTPEPSAFTSARAASPPRRRRTPPPPPNTAS